MDKYFDPTYDPRLDYTLTDVTDPSTGLIAEGAFDGWDRMLETVRARKEDKSMRATREGREEREEKSERRRERERRRAEREERRRKRRRRRGGGDAASDDEEDSHDGASDEEGDRSSYGGASRGGGGVMDVKYVKRGKAREWDLGKETPT